MKKLLLTMLFGCLFVGFAAAKEGGKTSYRNALIYAYSQANSVYEDDNIRLEIYNQYLWASNKTNKTIFIDLSQCFLVHNGSSFPLYADKQDAKHASKGGLSTSDDEFITIAPATGNEQNATIICYTGTGVYGEYTTTTSPSGKFTEYDKRLFSTIAELTEESLKADSKGKEYLGTASRHFTEDESINTIGASVAYAFNKKSEDWTSVTISTWVSDVIFAPYYVAVPEELDKKDKRGFAAKEIEPAVLHVKADTPFEFDQDKSPLILSDWRGDFREGTFELKAVNIFKRKFMKIVFTAEDVYKNIIQFDGPQADWGKMSYTNSFTRFILK